MTEETFWRNYFYRVSLIKQSTQINQLVSKTGEFSEADNYPKSYLKLFLIY